MIALVLAALLAPGRRLAFFAGTLAFLCIGALQAMYGPAFADFLGRYPIDVSQVGTIVSVHFLGSFTTVVLSGWLLRRIGYRRLLVVGGLLLAVGSLGVALSPSWSLVLASALVVGFGFGIFDVGANLLFGRVFAPQSAPALNILNAMFGVGAVLGPTLVGAFGATALWPFLILAGTSLLVALLSTRLPSPTPYQGKAGGRLALGAVSGFVLLFFLYVTAEVGVASWEPTHLIPYVGEARAALFTSLFWGALALGRLLAVPISARVPPGRLVLASSILALIAILLAQIVPLAPYAYALVGLAFAPIFPTGLAWIQRVFPDRAELVIPIVIAAANLAPVPTARPIGMVVAGTSSEAIPIIMAVAILLLVVTAGVLWWRTRGV